MNSLGPYPLPKCEHGRIDFEHCPKCIRRNKLISEAVEPLADIFWESRGKENIKHLLTRAYRMGMRHQSEKDT